MMRAILLTSFGVADDAARAACLDSLAADIRSALSGYELREAYTSNFIRGRLAKKGIHKDTMPEALERLAGEGCQEVYVQPTHLTPGEEYEKKVKAAVEAFQERFDRLKLGEALFASEADYEQVADFVQAEIGVPEGGALVLLGHGSPHQHNPVYERLQAIFDGRGQRIYIGVVEETDTPNYPMVLQRLREAGVKGVRLAPLLLSGGVHVTADMAGEGEGSWKSRLERDGLQVAPLLRGLGEYPAFRALYVKKAERLVGL